MTTHRCLRAWFVVLLSGVLALAPPSAAQALPDDPAVPPVSAPAPAVPVAAASTTSRVPRAHEVTLDATTGTLYALGDAGPARLFVLDARTCTAQRTECARPLASISLGTAALDVAVDPGSGTVYVSSWNGEGEASGFVLLVDARHCHAGDVSACEAVGFVRTGEAAALGMQLDPRTHTLYVGNGSSVSVIDTHACNAAHTAGCSDALAHATTTRSTAGFPALDRATDTLYVPNSGFNDHDAVDIVDTRTCNATDTSGCSRTPATFLVGTGATSAVVDPRTRTLYVSNSGSDRPRTGTVSVVDARRCNARTTVGCPTSPPPTALVGPVATALAVAPKTHALYAVASGADVVSVIDTRLCRAHHTSGCRRYPRTMQTGAEPTSITFDQATGSLYVANRADSTVQVLDASRCSGVRKVGCRRTAPTARATGNTGVLPDLHTIYQASNPVTTGDRRLTFIDTRTCNRSKHRRCTPRASIRLGYVPTVYVDPGSSTLYLADLAGHVVHLVDARRCNVTRRKGCTPFADVPVPGLTALTVNPKTRTVYANQGNAATLAVLPGVHCNALDHTRCDVGLHEVKLANPPAGVAFDVARDTVYVGTPGDQGETLLPSAACDAGSTACTVVARTFVGKPLFGEQAVVPERHSLYVAGGAGADTVTVVDTATCNAHSVNGCSSGSWSTTPAPHRPQALEYDPQADKVVVAGRGDSTVALIDPKACSAAAPAGCRQSWPRIPVGFQPASVQMDPRRNTLYTYNFSDQTVSLINLKDPCRPHLCVQPG